MKDQTSARGKSKKYVVAGATASTALLAAHTVIPAIAFAANQYSWIRQDIGNEVGSIYTVAMSASGNDLILGGGENLGIYISGNSGASWENVTEEIDPDVEHTWESVDVSNDGQTMVAASREGYHDIDGWIDGKIFVSENGGSSWSDVSPAETSNWNEVVVSGDGSTIAAVMSGEGMLYVSENDGADWSTSDFAEDSWNGKNVAISDNGNKILVGGENGENAFTHLHLSDDGGDTWEQVDPNEEDQIHTMSPVLSADGNTIAVATTGWNEGDNDSIFISEDDGADWTNITPEYETTRTWNDLKMSHDGTTLSAIEVSDGDNKMHISDNLGTNWTEENPTQDYDDESGLSVADLNSDGTKFIVATDDYAYLNYASENETTVTLDDAEGGKTIALTTPEGTTITCHSAVKESEQGVTDTAYTYPLGLVDFCFSGAEENNEVTLVFVTNLKPEDVLVRKYNPDNTEYATVDDATVTETTYEGKHALRVTYNIADNGPLDLDPDDGEVADPVGLAVVGDDGVLADTGASAANATLLAVGLLGIGFFFLLRRKKITE